MREFKKLPQIIFTPATKANSGDHDENINYQKTESIIGEDLASKIKEISIKIYKRASIYARSKGIIIADTKFEFGQDSNGKLYLIDEILTPDSSRFWPEETYKVGESPASYDKQYLRDYLETLSWNKVAPAPELPKDIIVNTLNKYREAKDSLTS